MYSLRTGAISVIDNATSGEAMALLALGPVSVRLRGDGSAEYVHLAREGIPSGAAKTTASKLDPEVSRTAVQQADQIR